MTITEFQETVSRMTQKIDSAALYRHYYSWSKASAKQDCPAESYILEHLPQQDQQEIGAVIAPYGIVTLSEINSAQRWFQGRKLPVYDTISGLYVDASSAEQLISFLERAMAIFPLFESFCQEHACPPSWDKYETFLKEIRGQYSKINHCPFRAYREYWELGVETLRPHLERWYAILAADIPGESTSVLSLRDAAEMMKITTASMHDWLQDHKAYITRQNGRIYLDLEQMRALKTAWETVSSFDDFLTKITANVPLVHRRSVCDQIRASIMEHMPAWILPEKTFPQQKTKLYIDPTKRAEARIWITERMDQIPIWSYKNLRERTKLSLRELRMKINEGLIQAEPYGDSGWLLCTNERNRILALSEILVSVEDVIEPILSDKSCAFQMDYVHNRENLLYYAENHNWWNAEVYRSSDYPLHGGKMEMLISVEDAEQIRDELSIWLLLYGKTYEEQWDTLCKVYADNFPKTINLLTRRYRWISSVKKSFIDMVTLLMKNLTKELDDMTEREKLELFNSIAEEATEAAKKEFVSFVKAEKVIRGYIELKPTGRKVDNSAYPLESFKLMTMAMLNQSEIKKRGLVEKAVADKTYAYLWLYTAIHLFLPWRSTDYIWVRAPELPYEPNETLIRIKEGSFSKEEAKLVAMRFIALLELDIRNPNKTISARNTQNLFYNFPESEQEVLGLILAIAAAHYYMTPSESCFIKSKNIANRITIASFYGSDFLQACQGRNYSGHRANKAMMQAVEFQGREGKHYHAEYAYIFSSMIRSHSFGYGEKSAVTDIYLRDAAFSGMTPGFIAFQMFQRGICSFIVDVMMGDCFGEQYKRLPVSIKTCFLKEVGIPLIYLDNTYLAIECAMDEAAVIVEEVTSGKAEMEEILRMIALGHGRGKDCSSICLCKAADQNCKCPARINCLGCRYEIKSKAVLAQYIMHCAQLKNKICHSIVEEQQRDWLLNHVIAPAIHEISLHIQDSSDKTERTLYKQIIQEVEAYGTASKDSACELQFLSGDIQS